MASRTRAAFIAPWVVEMEAGNRIGEGRYSFEMILQKGAVFQIDQKGVVDPLLKRFRGFQPTERYGRRPAVAQEIGGSQGSRFVAVGER